MESQKNVRLVNFLVFLLTGFIGFWSVSICYYSLALTGIIEEGFFTEHSRISFDKWATGILAIWFISLIFSFAGIFMHKKERGLLFAAPIVLPLLYGFTSLFVSG
jgi:hypothetical protein